MGDIDKKMTVLGVGQKILGFQTPTFVQNEQFSGGSGTVNVTFASSTTSGNFIVVGILIEDNSSTVSSVSDNKGNTYSASTSISSAWKSTRRIQIYHAYNISGGSSHQITVTISGGSTRVNALIHEYSKIRTSSDPLDVTSSGTPADDPTSGSASTTQNNDLVFGFIACDGGAPTEGSGFTGRSDYVFNEYTASEDKVLVTAGSTAADWTTVSTSTGIVQMACFKALEL